MRVTVINDENGKQVLGFDYPEGPAAPKPEPVVAEASLPGAKAPAKKGKGKPKDTPQREPDAPLGAE